MTSKQNTYSKIIKMSEKFNQPFHMNKVFCKERQEKKGEDIPCKNCESEMMCCIANKFLNYEQTVHELQDIINTQHHMLQKYI